MGGARGDLFGLVSGPTASLSLLSRESVNCPVIHLKHSSTGSDAVGWGCPRAGVSHVRGTEPGGQMRHTATTGDRPGGTESDKARPLHGRDILKILKEKLRP